MRAKPLLQVVGILVVSHNNADSEYGFGTIIQTIGASHCRTPSYDYGGRFYNASFRCTDNDGSSDDVWQEEATNYCYDTLFRDAKKKDVDYQLWDGSSLKYEISSYDDETASTGMAFISGQNPCIRVLCKIGYAKSGSICAPVKDVVKCKESSNNEHPYTGYGWKKCSEHDGTSCLKTGSNTYLYCYKKDNLRGVQEEDLGNSCIAGVHKVVSKLHNGSYFECDANGIWQKHDFDRCPTGDQFPGGCNGVPGCVDEIVDKSTSKSVTDASGVGQQLISDTGMTYCIRSVCDENHELQNGTCVSKQVIADKKAADARARAVTNQKRQNCENSFGTWSGGKCVCDLKDNLVSEANNLTCKCIDDRYERNPQNRKCELTSVEQKKKLCDAAASSGAVWNQTKCECSMPNKVWSGTQCVYPDGFEQCQHVQGAKWDNGSCVCKDSTKELDATRTKCVDSEETIRKRKVVSAQSSITSAVGKLENIVDGLDVSKWKTEDGNFNTARLASDSIAGVVLGTAGGLITSSVVKKHQVEDGFEDLQCTIGGQTVANWGDEFQVGVR